MKYEDEKINKIDFYLFSSVFTKGELYFLYLFSQVKENIPVFILYSKLVTYILIVSI